MKVIAQKSSVKCRIIELEKDFVVVFALPKKKQWHLFEFEVR